MRPAAALVLSLTLCVDLSPVLAAEPAQAATPALAPDVTPLLQDHRLGVSIQAIALPATFPKDLVSGLTNTLLIHVTLLSGSRSLAQKTAEIAMKYDLWDETFTVTTKVEGAVLAVQPHATRQQVDALVADIRLPQLFPLSVVPPDDTTVLRAELLLNPIERERIEAIKKWVAENSTYTPADTPGYSDKRVGSSHSNAIFNRIFEQYAHGADVAAAWRESLSSKPFKIGELLDER
jgi:hypothetical protein